jgi:hypothetical protein
MFSTFLGSMGSAEMNRNIPICCPCDTDIDLPSDDRFWCLASKMFQQICRQLAQSVGNNRQLVMTKMNHGHLHSLLFLMHKITFFVYHERNAANL